MLAFERRLMMKSSQLVMLVLVALCSTAGAVSVSWIPDHLQPTAWTIHPSNPAPGDVISFSGPTDLTYGNSCGAEMALGGEPGLAIDAVNRVVELVFNGPPPTICPLIWMPVSGLEGDFGPLAPGAWVFKCTSPGVAFEINFVIPGGGVIYVDADAPHAFPNGSSWFRAYRRLQNALAAAAGGDEIRVAQGVYTPDQGTGITPGDREAAFELKAGVSWIGGFAGYGMLNPDARDTAAYEVILNGDLQGDDLWNLLNKSDNSYQVVRALGNGNMDGFTVTAGQAEGPHPFNHGAGLFINEASLVLVNCKFTDNTAALGGGISLLNSSASIVNTEFHGNRALVQGGALYVYNSAVGLTNCLLTGNASDYAELTGGSAIYGMGATLGIASCTLADNTASNGRAIVNFTWGSPPSGMVTVANSILYNGGDELWSNDPATMAVNHSDVQGAWPGPGNIDEDPDFVGPGVRGIEGQWFEGDYRLNATSQLIDAGDQTQRPPDQVDLDGDGNTTELLPVDLDDSVRVQSADIDMGAYESASPGPGPGPGPSPGPGPGWVAVTTINITMDVPHFSFPINVSASGSRNVQLNFKADLMLGIVPTSPAGGNWSAWFDPDPNPIGPGLVTVHYEIRGQNVDITQLTAGAIDVKVAELTIYASAATPLLFFEDFESYANGTNLHGLNGWEGWDGNASAGAPASDAFASSGSKSVEITGSTDLVQELNIAGGTVIVSAMQYIPSGTTGTTYFVMLNQYGGPYDWSVQTTFNLDSGTIGFWNGDTATIVYDQWVELKYVIDLDNNTVDKHYNGAFITTDPWDNSVHGTLGAIDLFGDGASSVYYDNVMVN
jgi:hypothetical protein